MLDHTRHIYRLLIIKYGLIATIVIESNFQLFKLLRQLLDFLLFRLDYLFGGVLSVHWTSLHVNAFVYDFNLQLSRKQLKALVITRVLLLQLALQPELGYLGVVR